MKSNKILSVIAVCAVVLAGSKGVYAQINKQIPKNTLMTEAFSTIQKDEAKVKVINTEDVNLKITEYSANEAISNKVIKAAIDKIYSYFPETKQFEISSIHTNKGNVTGQEMNFTMIGLKEKVDNGKELNFTIDATTGTLLDIQQVNWKATDKSIAALNKEEIKGRADELLTKLGVDLKEYQCEIDDTYLEKQAKEIKGIGYAEGDKRLDVRYKQTKDENGKAFLVYFENNNICVKVIEHANEYNFGSEFQNNMK